MKAPEKKLIALLDKYLPAEGEMSSGGETMNSLYLNLQNPEMLIPVLGLQGVGKSTLINGILEEDIMPNEADETTCIPVEVRYGVSAAAVVRFQNGKKEEIAKSALAQYVDNNYNRGNEKQVSRIVLEKDSELLKNGVVLVDLPGVGSITSANAETTKNYIKRLHSAIFVIRVVPPITRTEAAFIKIAWNSLSNAWFVQNRWNNETDREAAEGLDANTVILKDIAEKTQLPYSGEVLTVNAYKALVGVLKHDAQSIAGSNIAELTQKLKAFNANWKAEVAKAGVVKTLSIFSLVISTVKDLIEKYKLSKNELEKKLREEGDRFKKTTAEIDRQIAEIESLLDGQKIDAGLFISKLVRKAEENIRANVYHVIDEGVTDGEDLTRVFNDYQTQEFAIVNDDYGIFIRDFARNLGKQMSELNDILETEQKQSFSASTFSKRQKFKWEKGMDAVIKIGGGVGGVFAGIAAGAAIGTAIPIPIVGTIGGALVGLVVGIIASLIGSGSRKLVMQQRASETKREITPIINEVCENIKKELKKAFDSICDDIAKKLQSYSADRKAQAQLNREEAEEMLKSDNDAGEKLKELNADLEYLRAEEAAYHV